MSESSDHCRDNGSRSPGPEIRRLCALDDQANWQRWMDMTFTRKS